MQAFPNFLPLRTHVKYGIVYHHRKEIASGCSSIHLFSCPSGHRILHLQTSSPWFTRKSDYKFIEFLPDHHKCHDLTKQISQTTFCFLQAWFLAFFSPCRSFLLQTIWTQCRNARADILQSKHLFHMSLLQKKNVLAITHISRRDAQSWLKGELSFIIAFLQSYRVASGNELLH